MNQDKTKLTNFFINNLKNTNHEENYFIGDELYYGSDSEGSGDGC